MQRTGNHDIDQDVDGRVRILYRGIEERKKRQGLRLAETLSSSRDHRTPIASEVPGVLSWKASPVLYAI